MPQNQPFTSERNQELIEAVKSLVEVYKNSFGKSWETAFTSSVVIRIGHSEGHTIQA
jgi:hypothetical protein